MELDFNRELGLYSLMLFIVCTLSFIHSKIDNFYTKKYIKKESCIQPLIYSSPYTVSKQPIPLTPINA